MSWWRGRDGYRREVEEELRDYLELRARELEEEGMAPQEAWWAAVEAFGDPDRIEEEVLEMREQERKALPDAPRLTRTIWTTGTGRAASPTSSPRRPSEIELEE